MKLCRPCDGLHRSSSSGRVGREEREGKRAHPLDQTEEHVEHDVVGPVEVGDRDDERLGACDRAQQLLGREPGVLAGACRLDVVHRLGVPEEVQEAARRPGDLGFIGGVVGRADRAHDRVAHGLR